jgi:hypothetical protein
MVQTIYCAPTIFCAETLFLKWIDGRVGAGPDAAGASIQVARKPMAAAVRQDTTRLIWQVFRGIYHLNLQANLFVYMLAILHFQGVPGFFSHCHAPFNN